MACGVCVIVCDCVYVCVCVCVCVIVCVRTRYYLQSILTTAYPCFFLPSYCTHLGVHMLQTIQATQASGTHNAHFQVTPCAEYSVYSSALQ